MQREGTVVPYCARFSRHIVARANERVHVHNERNFPQANLDSKTNVPLCDVYVPICDRYFLSPNNPLTAKFHKKMPFLTVKLCFWLS